MSAHQQEEPETVREAWERTRLRWKNLKWPRLWMRLGGWFIFGVLVSLVPVGLIWTLRALTSQDHDLGHIVSDGELLLISAVIAAAAAGDLLSRKRKRFNLSAGEMAVVGGAMLLLFGGGGTYAGIAALNHLKVTAQAGTNDEVKKYLTTMISADNGWPEIWCWSAFGASLLLGACSIFVIALEEAG